MYLASDKAMDLSSTGTVTRDKDTATLQGQQIREAPPYTVALRGEGVPNKYETCKKPAGNGASVENEIVPDSEMHFVSGSSKDSLMGKIRARKDKSGFGSP